MEEPLSLSRTMVDEGETAPVVKSREEHQVSRRDMDPDALKVLYRLSQQGYIAYLVGGGVRDLLLGRKPKDFDISTNAHPQEIKRLFRNAFLIGRRFRLVHVRFGTKVIETSTFRRIPDPKPGEEQDNLLQHRDNTFGTPEEDARRRDFTVNALFYDIKSFSIIDHVGGLEDLHRKVIRCIGDPNVRFREDPVRMLRAVRFAARLGFTIEPTTYQGILDHHREISLAAPSRLLEEVARLFSYSSGEKSFRLLRQTGLLSVIMPDLNDWLDSRSSRIPAFWRLLAGVDRMDREGTPPTQALMFSVLTYPMYCDEWDEARQHGATDAHEFAGHTLSPSAARFHMPRRVAFDAQQIMTFQNRMETPPRHGTVARLAHHEWFASALVLRRLWLEATDAGRDEVITAWERAATEAPQAGPPHPHRHDAAEREGPFRRRRSRRRGGRGRGRGPAGAPDHGHAP